MIKSGQGNIHTNLLVVKPTEEITHKTLMQIGEQV